MLKNLDGILNFYPEFILLIIVYFLNHISVVLKNVLAEIIIIL